MKITHSSFVNILQKDYGDSFVNIISKRNFKDFLSEIDSISDSSVEYGHIKF